MKKNLLRSLGIGSVLFVGIQFIVPDENHDGNFENDIIKTYVVPENVHAILNNSPCNFQKEEDAGQFKR
jgi:hypothetical protein